MDMDALMKQARAAGIPQGYLEYLQREVEDEEEIADILKSQMWVFEMDHPRADKIIEKGIA